MHFQLWLVEFRTTSFVDSIWTGRLRFFRFNNEWFYILTGEILSFREEESRSRSIDGVFLSAIVDHAKESFLYRGIIKDWTFDSAGRLDTIRLALPHRRLLTSDRKKPLGALAGKYVEPDDRYYEIRGDVFVLRYAEIKTMNLDYFTLDDASPAADPLEMIEIVHLPDAEE